MSLCLVSGAEVGPDGPVVGPFDFLSLRIINVILFQPNPRHTLLRFGHTVSICFAGV